MLQDAGLVVNLEKEKRWNRMTNENLSILGMLVKEGKREKVKDVVDQVLMSGILRGVEREHTGWKKIAYINSTIIPRIRHKLAVFWEKGCWSEVKEAEVAIRKYAKHIEWPEYVKDDFVYNKEMGLGMLSLKEEVEKDIICYLWNVESQGEEVKKAWDDAWRLHSSGGESKRIEFWKTAVEKLTDMTILNNTYRGRPKEGPFPFGNCTHLHKTTTTAIRKDLPKKSSRKINVWKRLKVLIELM